MNCHVQVPISFPYSQQTNSPNVLTKSQWAMNTDVRRGGWKEMTKNYTLEVRTVKAKKKWWIGEKGAPVIYCSILQQHGRKEGRTYTYISID